MAKYIVVIEALDDENAELFTRQDHFGMVRSVHEVYRDAYDIDYNTFIFRCFPPVGDPQPVLADEEYLFKIGLATTPDNFDRIKDQVERMANELSIDYLSYESHGKPVE
jgi:hypothetical protein